MSASRSRLNTGWCCWWTSESNGSLKCPSFCRKTAWIAKSRSNTGQNWLRDCIASCSCPSCVQRSFETDSRHPRLMSDSHRRKLKNDSPLIPGIWTSRLNSHLNLTIDIRRRKSRPNTLLIPTSDSRHQMKIHLKSGNHPNCRENRCPAPQRYQLRQPSNSQTPTGKSLCSFQP